MHAVLGLFVTHVGVSRNVDALDVGEIHVLDDIHTAIGARRFVKRRMNDARERDGLTVTRIDGRVVEGHIVDNRRRLRLCKSFRREARSSRR